MLYRAKFAVCSEMQIKHKNELCSQNVEFFNVKHGNNLRYELGFKGPSEQPSTGGPPYMRIQYPRLAVARKKKWQIK